ncbi:SpoIIE family protein phosphatase [Streptomyces sp. NPDC001388]|uniref:SpoIIE family protein phosphatase n=1 Tax=Streptomyces sp. NPDC001388 TaxID=3364568 RepID=UPI003673E502
MTPGEDAGRPRAAGPGLWHRVVEQLDTALVVVDPTGRVAAVNPAAERVLGRTAAAMHGQDVHDLLHRGPDGARIPREQCPLLRALAAGSPGRGENDGCLLGDGRLVPVTWSASPLTDDGVPQGTAVIITEPAGDGPTRRERAERAARTHALVNLTERLTLVAEITDVLGQTLETEEAPARLGRLLVPRLADWAAVDLLTGPGRVHRVSVTGPEGRDAAQEGLRAGLPSAEAASLSPLVQVLSGGDPVLWVRADPGTPSGAPPDSPSGAPLDAPPGSPPEQPLDAVHRSFLRATGASSVLTVPLGTGQQLTGALTLVRTDPAHPFGTGDLEAVGDIGRRVGLVIDNARRFGRQRAVAEAMQRNLLPPLPRHGRLRLAARYQPAPAGSQVGGDWYDAFGLKDGALALVIGDVVGHDLTAAAGMAQLHGILRSLAWDHTGPPAAVVDRLDDALPAITTVPMATLVLARVEGPPDGPWTLRWTSAGHPPPLLLTGDGDARYLEAGQGMILGARLGAVGQRPDGTHPLPPGSTLLLYTDGLIEVPGSDLDTGLRRLRRHALALAGEPLESLCDRLSARMSPGSTDDIALLALRLPPP